MRVRRVRLVPKGAFGAPEGPSARPLRQGVALRRAAVSAADVVVRTSP